MNKTALATSTGLAYDKLVKIKDSRAVEPLLQLLKDEDEAIRRVVTVALGEIGDTRAV